MVVSACAAVARLRTNIRVDRDTLAIAFMAISPWVTYQGLEVVEQKLRKIIVFLLHNLSLND